MFNYDEFENLSSGIEQGDYIKNYLTPTNNLSSDDKFKSITEKINEINWKYISQKINLKPDFYTYKIYLSDYGFTTGYETRYNDIGMIDLLYGDLICAFQDLTVTSNNKTIIENIIEYINNNQQWVEPPFGKIEGINYPPYRSYSFGYFLTYDFYNTYTYEIVRNNSSTSSSQSNSSYFNEVKKEINSFVYKFCGCPPNLITKYQNLTENFISENIKYLSMDYLCKFQLFNNQFFIDNVNGISYSVDLEPTDESLSSSSDSSLNQIIIEWNFDLLSKYQRWNLDDDNFINNFLKINYEKINWDDVCKYQNVPVGFSNNISFEDGETLTNKIGFDTDSKINEYKDINPYYQSLTDKINKLSDYFTIENPDDSDEDKYILTYKSVTKNRNTENYRPREEFSVGNIYDCSTKRTFERYTDRYAVGVQESFFEHYGTDKFIKVKVYIKDIFNITDFGRLEVNKFEVVEDSE